MRYSFVILHYMAAEYTRQCISSILDLKKESGDELMIYVVDNASPDGSGRELLEEYSGEKQVRVLLCRKNIGFARGNNIGFRRAKKAGTDFLIMLNNDTKIEDKFFLGKIKSIYDREAFAVLGPDIFAVKRDVHQNPCRGVSLDVRKMRGQRLRFQAGRLFNLFGLYEVAFKLKDKLEHKDKPVKRYTEELICTAENGFVLHGSCFIFSEEYLKLFSGLDPRTYMYLEEQVLAAHCFSKGLKLFYSPEIQVLHFEDASTDSLLDADRKKTEFKLKNSIESLKVLEEVCKK